MLNFDQQPQTNSNLSEPSWKVLIYDDIGQDIISPILTVKELRDIGVTAHLYFNEIYIYIYFYIFYFFCLLKIKITTFGTRFIARCACYLFYSTNA